MQRRDQVALGDNPHLDQKLSQRTPSHERHRRGKRRWNVQLLLAQNAHHTRTGCASMAAKALTSG
jgi:hypothetical protein